MRAIWPWLLVLMSLPVLAADVPVSPRSKAVIARVQPGLTAELRALGADWGAPLYLRIFKASNELEAFVRTSSGAWSLLRNWPICTWSGRLGPKTRQGDMQAPEGFYEVAARQLNPVSNYHLAFNLGYPNAYDRHHRRSGDYLMVHGNCVSIGCYAMGDAAIEEIYSLVAGALAHGQRSVPVHAFPFRFEAGWEQAHAGSEWLPFWRQLEPAYRDFVAGAAPPQVRAVAGEYRVGAAAEDSD